MGVIGPIAVLALVLGAVAISKFASADDGPPPPDFLAVDAERAPGMIRVWIDPDVRLSEGRSYRIRWWSVDVPDGGEEELSLVGTVVLNARDRESQGPVAITGLAAGLYEVELDVIGGSSINVGRIAITDAGAALGPCPQDEDVSICATFVTNTPALGTPVTSRLAVDFFTGTTSASSFTVGSDPVTYALGRSTALQEGWPNDTDGSGEPAWTRFRMVAADRDAQLAVHWWSAFGDPGVSAETATELLVPRNAGSVNLGAVVLTPGTRIFGELMKAGPGGEAVRLVAADLVDLCTQVLRVVDGRTEYVNEACGQGGHPVLWDGQANEDDDEWTAGEWQLALKPGTYVVRFIDRPNYFGTTNLLLYNVKFAAEWWSSDTTGPRKERLDDAERIVLVADQPRNLGQRVLRDARQLRVKVTGIPEELVARNGATIQRDQLEGSIRVGDGFGNWAGGALDVGRIDPEIDPETDRVPPQPGTAEASVTGLVPGRPYRIIITFEEPNSGYFKWWLVGGGTLEDAAFLEASAPLLPDADPAGDLDLIIEPWPVSPLLVTVHDQYGEPYGPDEACVALVPPGRGVPRASSCVTGRWGVPAGSAFLQRITLKEQEEDEEYRVVVFRNQPGGVARGLGQPVRLTELRTAVLDSEYTVGVGDLTGLIDGWELPGGTDPSSAVVLVDPTRSEPPPPMMVMSIHDEKGDPYGDGQACVAFYTDEGTEQSVVPPGCTMTIEVPGWGGPVSGFVLMQSPPVGQYRVEVFIDDESQLTITEFEVVRRPPIIGGYATGPSDTSGLLEGESIDSPPYDERIAIVVPRGGS